MRPCVCAGQDAADPYWARPWPSAVALAQELLRRPDLVAGRRVCEVAAGLGVATIAAALAGACQPDSLHVQPIWDPRCLQVPLEVWML